MESVALEDVVAQHQTHAVIAYEVGSYGECLRQSVGAWLLGIGEAHAYVASVTQQALESRQVKDVLWKELNSESNKLQEITAEDTLVHRDKDMSRFQQELEAEGEDIVEYIDEDEIEDVDDLDDFEYE